MLKTLWSAYKVPIIVAAVIVGVVLIATYQWGYINGKNSK